MTEASNKDDKNQNQSTNVELDENGPHIMTDATNDDVQKIISSEPNRPDERQQPTESALKNDGKPSRSVSKPRYHEKVCKCCPGGFCCMVGRRMVCNEQLSAREIALRQRLATLECWIPAVTLIKVLAGEIDSSNIYNLIDEQASKIFISKSHPHSTLSHHNEGGAHDIEIERKEAHRRLEEARKLLREKQSAVNKRAKQIEEAERKHTSLEQKIGQLEEQLSRNGIDLTKLPSTESITSFGPDDLAYITKLEELIAAEKHTQRELEELERREEIYMNTLKSAEHLMPKDKKNSEVDELRSQLEIKSVANQQLADRICLLEDQVEILKGKLAGCYNHLEKLTGSDGIQAMDGASVSRDTAKVKSVTIAAGSDHDTVKRKEQGIHATVRTDTKETYARVELTDRSVQEPIETYVTGNQDQLLRISQDQLRLPENSEMNRENSDNNLPLPPGTDMLPRTIPSALSHDYHSTSGTSRINTNASFKSLPSQVEQSNWSTFSDINQSGVPTGGTQRPQNDASFVSLLSALSSHDETGGFAEANPISTNNREGASQAQPIQPDATGFGQANTFGVPPQALTNEELRRKNDPKFVSLLSQIDENNWSTFSDAHEPQKPEEYRPPVVQQGNVDGFMSLASTVHDSGTSDIAPAQSPGTTTNVVPTTQVQPRQISEDSIQITKRELQGWLNFVRETRRHMSQCATCVWKRRELVLLCKAMCHYLKIRFSVCTEDEEVVPLSPEPSLRDTSRRHQELSSMGTSIGVPVGMSSRHENNARPFSGRIDIMQHSSSGQHMNTLSHDRAIDNFTDNSISHTSRQLAQQTENAGESGQIRSAGSSSHGRMTDRAANTLSYNENRSTQQPHLTADSRSHSQVIDSTVPTTDWEYHNMDRVRQRNQTIDSTHHRKPTTFNPYTSLPVDPSKSRQPQPIDESEQTRSTGYSLPSNRTDEFDNASSLTESHSTQRSQLTGDSRSRNQMTDTSASTTEWTYFNVNHMTQPSRPPADSQLYDRTNDSAAYESTPGEEAYYTHHSGAGNRQRNHTIDSTCRREPPQFHPSTSLPVDPSRPRQQRPNVESRQIRFAEVPSGERSEGTHYGTNDSTQYGELPSPNRTTGSSTHYTMSDSTQYGSLPSPNRTVDSSIGFDTTGSSNRHQTTDSTQYEGIQMPNRIAELSTSHDISDVTQYGRLPSPSRTAELSTDHELSDVTQYGGLPSPNRTTGSSTRHQITDSTQYGRTQSPNRTTGSSTRQQTTDSNQYERIHTSNRTADLSTGHDISDVTQYRRLPSPHQTGEFFAGLDSNNSTQYGGIPSPNGTGLSTRHQIYNSSQNGEFSAPDQNSNFRTHTSTPEQTDRILRSQYGRSIGNSQNAEAEASLNGTSYISVGIQRQDQNIRDEMRGHSSGGNHTEMSLEQIMRRKPADERREKSTDRKSPALSNLSSFHDDVRHHIPSLQRDLSDSESQYDLRNESDEKRKIWRREEKRNVQRPIRRGQERPSTPGQCISHLQSILQGACCTCEISHQFPKITRSEYERFISSDDGRGPHDCLAESVLIRNKKLDAKHKKIKRPHSKDIKIMTTSSIETQANIRHRDVNSKHLPDFSCEVCDCEPCGTPSTFHSNSDKTQVNASTNVSPRSTKKNQSASAKIARANR